MYYGNYPGVTQTTTSPQQSMYTYGPAYSSGANSPALSQAYMQTAPYYTPAQGQSNGQNIYGGLNLPGAEREWNSLMSSLYGNPTGMPNTGGSGGGSNNGGNTSSNGSNANAGTTVTSTITPRNVYNETDIARNTSNRVANALAAGDSRLLQQRFAGRGRSLDSGTKSAVMPAVAAAENAAAEARIGGPVQDWYTNQGNLLQGQVGRAGESLGLANILSQLQGAQQQYQTSMLMPLLNMAMGGY